MPESTPDATSPVVRNALERSRYELIVDEQIVGVADYRIDGDVVIFPHTEIVAHQRGRGYGALLIQGALDDVRASGRSVVARCWFVEQFLDANPDYADLRAA